MVALARPVWIQWADAVWVRALLVRCPVLKALDDRLNRHTLQAEDRYEHQGEGLCPFSPGSRGSRTHDDARLEESPDKNTRRSFLLSTLPHDQA